MLTLMTHTYCGLCPVYTKICFFIFYSMHLRKNLGVLVSAFLSGLSECFLLIFCNGASNANADDTPTQQFVSFSC
jgi:hypothetical protein